MLSYQHAYHAGCPADVHKHAVLAHILQYLAIKHPRVTYIDTHSGRGVYNLTSPEAQKTGEAQHGIVKLLAEKKLAGQPLGDVLRQIRGRLGKDVYPGSPMLAQKMLRDCDDLHLFELHPAENLALKHTLPSRNVKITRFDGYEGAWQMCPPSPSNGVMLIDPSYEIKSEYSEAVGFVREMAERWPTGIQLLWYPMLQAENHVPMVEALESDDLPGFYHQQIQFCEPGEVRGMYGSGVILVNLPPELEEFVDSVREIFS